MLAVRKDIAVGHDVEERTYAVVRARHWYGWFRRRWLVGIAAYPGPPHSRTHIAWICGQLPLSFAPDDGAKAVEIDAGDLFLDQEIEQFLQVWQAM
jgi:hypothetical protein